jgi:hypothetical protein
MDPALETVLETPGILTRLAVEFGPRVMSAALVLVVGYFVMRWAAALASRALARFPLEPPVRELLLRVVRALVFLLFLLMALQNLGIELLPLVAGLGIAGAGIALALQGVLGNVAAGLVGGFPVGASTSRSVTADAAGAQTQLAQLLAAVVSPSASSAVRRAPLRTAGRKPR